MSDVFISYSRRNKDFTQTLYKALTESNRTVWADWDSIPAASDWLAEIKRGIEETNAVLFVITPEWIMSDECRKEFNYAVEMNKRLFPILRQQINEDLPAELAKINWIYMRDTDDFEQAFHTLCAALDTDLDWVKDHTRIQSRALEWDKKKRDASFLLHGKDLTDAERFIADAARKKPEATHLQGEYILASRKDASRRQRMAMGGVIAALVISIVLGIVAVFQRQIAVRAELSAKKERDRAIAAEAIAITNEKEAKLQQKISRTRELAAQSTALRDQNFQAALLLGLESYKTMEIPSSFGIVMDNAHAFPRLRYFLNGYVSWANSLALSPDGNWLAFTDKGSKIVVWDMKNKRVAKTLTGHSDHINSLSFHPNGHMLASGSSDQTVILWDLNTGQSIRVLTGNTAAVTTVAFSPDGNVLASGSEDNTLLLWDTKTGEQIGAPLAGHTMMIDAMAFSPDGTLATGDDAGMIFLWDVKNHQRIGELSVASYTVSKTLDNWVNSLAFSPDGSIIASVSQNGSIVLWDAKTYQPIGERLTMHNDAVNCISFSPDGKTFATGGDDHSIMIWNAATRDLVEEPYMSTSMVYSVLFTPDGKSMVANYRDNTVVLWDIKSPNVIEQNSRVKSLAFRPDGKIFASANGQTVSLWDFDTHEEVGKPLEGHTDVVNAVAFSPDGKTLASGGNDKKIILWNLALPESPSSIFTITRPGQQEVTSLAFSPDGKTLASGNSDATITLWDVNTGKQIGLPLRGHIESVNAVAFSPDGKMLASGGDDRKVILWDVRNFNVPVQLAVFSKHSSLVFTVSFSPDGKILASGSSDISIIFWDVTTLQPIGDPLTAHTSGVASLAFSPDGKMLASGSSDKTILLWDTQTRTPLGGQLTGHTEFVKSVVFNPTANVIVSGGNDGKIFLWDIDLQSWLETSCQRAGRNLTKSEWEKYFPDEPYRKTCEQWPLEAENP